MTDDGAEFNEWVAITTLDAKHETQLNVCTGEIRHRRPGARYELVGSPPQMTAVEDDWVPGHPPD